MFIFSGFISPNILQDSSYSIFTSIKYFTTIKANSVNPDLNLHCFQNWIYLGLGCTIGLARHTHTVKPVLSGHSKTDKTKVSKTNGSLLNVESIAECSLGAFCNTFDLHSAIIGLENQFLVFFLSGRL